MIRAFLAAIVICMTLSGCEALAQAAAQQRAEQQAAIDDLKSRIADLTPEQKDAVQRCSSIAVGKINTLRNAGQGAAVSAMNDYTVVNACLDNPYFYETIPAPAVVIKNQPERNDGGLSLYQQCLAAQAAGSAVCQ